MLQYFVMKDLSRNRRVASNEFNYGSILRWSCGTISVVSPFPRGVGGCYWIIMDTAVHWDQEFPNISQVILHVSTERHLAWFALFSCAQHTLDQLFWSEMVWYLFLGLAWCARHKKRKKERKKERKKPRKKERKKERTKKRKKERKKERKTNSCFFTTKTIKICDSLVTH